MPPESGNRFRDKDMRENKKLKRMEQIWKIATRFRTFPGKPRTAFRPGSRETI